MSDPLAKMIATLSPEKKAKLASLLRIGREPIAVLGLSCRFPGGSDGPDAFWRLLESGIDGVREVPTDRWPIDEYYHPDPQAPGKMYTRWAGFLNEVDKFDSGFFGISPREAARMDPQQRIFLEVAWEALEDAGQSADTLSGSPVGVFTGVCANDYCAIQFGDLDALDAYVATGNAHSIVANRLSYLLDFIGPSVAVDTACSSSLVAVHLACQSLHAGDCSTAVVGGVHLILTPHGHIIFSKAQMMAPDGRCKAFDARADGFARGEGCGVVVLRRLSDALAANDPIRAVILGSAVNQDGRSNGLMAPSGLSQQEVIRRAYQQANVDPEQIEYIEAHGTGTSLGDPIEIEALAEVFGPPRPDGFTCAIGAVKTNIGHLEAAAGIAGLIKAVLSLEREVIPPNLHFKSLNPNIALERMPFAIPTSPIPWPSNGRPRYVGVSSFGFGGTNAHALLGAAPTREPATGSQEERRLHLLAVSARAPDSLRELATAYRDYLTGSPPAIGDICYTAAVRRSHHKHRIAVLGRTRDDLVARIDAYLAGRLDVDVAHGGEAAGKGLVFVYSGQGGQWAKMGHRLALDEPVFQAALERCAATFAPLVPWSLVDELAAPEDRSRLDRTDVAQPALFALQVALTELWRSWGVQPDAVVGHSLGEVTAAYVAGALTLDEAAQVIVHRARLMQRTLDRGMMIAVELSGDEAARATAALNGVRLAAVNGPQSVVLSGETAAVKAMEASLRTDGIVCRRLRVRYAFHSPLMDALREEFEDSVQGLDPQETLVPLYSTVSGGRVDGRSLDREHWANNMCQPVQFAPAIAALQEQNYHAFLEVGPHVELSGAIARISDSNGGKAQVFASLRRGDDERSTMLRATAGLYAASLRPHFPAIYPAGVSVPLPRYPWRRERHWQQPEGDPARMITSTMRGKAGHPLLGNRVRAAVPEVIFQAMLRATAPSFLSEHRLHGRVIVPAVAFLEMVLAAAASSFGTGPVQIEDVLLQEPLIIPDDGGTITQLTLVRDGSKEHASFRIFSLSPDDESNGGAWRLHVSGAVRKAAVAERHHEPINDVVARLTEVPAENFYEVLESLGFSYGPRFKAITRLWCGNGEAIGRIELDQQLDGDNAWAFHPCLLEGCLQTVGGLAADAHVTGDDVYIPIALERFSFYGDTVGRRLWSHARLRDADAAHGETVRCDVTLVEDGRVAGRIEGLILKRASREALQRRARAATNDWLYEVEWRDQPSPEPVGSEGPPPAWLVFADEDGFGADVCARLTAAGCTTVMVTRGSAFRVLGPGRFEVDPADVVATREALAAASAELSGGIDRVLYLWGLDIRFDANGSGAELAHAQETGCQPALNLVQALAEADAAWQPPRLWLVTRGAQAVNGSLNARGLAQSPLWGLGAAAALEHPDLWGGMIDLDPHGEPDAETLVTALTADDGEDRSALRNGQRWVPRLIQLASRRLLPEQIQPDPNACYLITGGLGGLGLEVARGLAERGARHLVLMSRHHRPEAQSAIDEIRRLGVIVDVVLGDVAVAQEVMRMLAEIATGPTPLRGVVHAAGVLDDGVLTRQSWNRFETVFAPKLSGAWELHRQTQTLPLDFFVLFSSAAGILGSPGQASYAAANMFLDALAHLRRRQGLPATAIDWGPWANVGMAASTTAAGAQLRSQTLRIDPDEGVRLMVQLVAGGLTQAAVLPVDRAKLVGLWPTATVPPLLAAIMPEEVASASTAAIDVEMLAKLRATPPAERADVLASFIRAQIIEILRADPADPPDLSRGLFDMGMDSLMALELKNRLQNVIGQTIPPTLVLEHPTIDDLSSYVVDEFFQASSDASAPDDDQVAETMARIDAMSAEELAAAVNPAVLSELSKLSDEEVDRRLAELLQRKGRR